MELWIWAATGAVAGLIASKLMRGRSYGLIGNVVIGLLGSLIGSWLVELVAGSVGETWWQRMLVAALGAVVLLAAARHLRPLARRSPHEADDSIASHDLESQISRLSAFERRIVTRILGKQKPRDPNEAFDEQMTFGEKVADQVAAFGGSWTFIGLFVLFMFAWMIVNSHAKQPVDVFPFILLNLMLSCLAALQAPVIMMSQNRQSAKDRNDAKLDFEVNLRAEANITKVLEAMESREAELRELIEINRRQLVLLEKKSGPASAGTAG